MIWHPCNPWLDLVSEIFKICRHAEIPTTNELDHHLELVPLFSGDADLSVLQLALNLEVLGFDRLDDFLGFVAFESLLNL